MLRDEKPTQTADLLTLDPDNLFGALQAIHRATWSALDAAKEAMAWSAVASLLRTAQAHVELLMRVRDKLDAGDAEATERAILDALVAWPDALRAVTDALEPAEDDVA